jgi:hypothetical protein
VRLLVGDPDQLCHLLLGQAAHDAALAYPTANMVVRVAGAATAGPWARSGSCRVNDHVYGPPEISWPHLGRQREVRTTFVLVLSFAEDDCCALAGLYLRCFLHLRVGALSRCRPGIVGLGRLRRLARELEG